MAFSGGGDSLALLHLAKAWTDRAGRRLVALTVDHGLQPASARLDPLRAPNGRPGSASRIARWPGRGAKPAAGLPAAARTARHALLAQAARREGAAVILMGHTADDLIEGEADAAGRRQRAAAARLVALAGLAGGSRRLPAAPAAGASPAELRALLRSLGESWIDDPANDDPRFARALARRRLAGRDATAPPAVEALAPWRGLGDVRQGVAGELAAPSALLAAPDDETRRALGALTVCAAGTLRAPAAASLGRIAARLAAGEDFTASLAGARIEAVGERVMFCREAGERLRRAHRAGAAGAGESVFDGRFRVDCAVAGTSHRVPGRSRRAAAGRRAPAPDATSRRRRAARCRPRFRRTAPSHARSLRSRAALPPGR